MAGWWYTYLSEKYEFVSWNDEIHDSQLNGKIIIFIVIHMYIYIYIVRHNHSQTTYHIYVPVTTKLWDFFVGHRHLSPALSKPAWVSKELHLHIDGLALRQLRIRLPGWTTAGWAGSR